VAPRTTLVHATDDDEFTLYMSLCSYFHSFTFSILYAAYKSLRAATIFLLEGYLHKDDFKTTVGLSTSKISLVHILSKNGSNENKY